MSRHFRTSHRENSTGKLIKGGHAAPAPRDFFSTGSGYEVKIQLRGKSGKLAASEAARLNAALREIASNPKIDINVDLDPLHASIRRRAESASKRMKRAEDEQLQLYRDKVIERVIDRFDSREQAETWFETEPLPGYGTKTARDLVSAGFASKVIELINAIEAGVHA